MIRIKEIEGYEGLYFVDTLGNVVAFPKKTRVNSGSEYVCLKQQVKKGYAIVNLYDKDKKMKSLTVHRLVAKAFISNPQNYSDVNHINGIKLDNRVENLEWCSKQQNTKHAFDNNLGGFKDRALDNLKKINNKYHYKKIDLVKNDIVISFETTDEVAKFLGSTKQAVADAIKNNKKLRYYTLIGYKEFANEEA